MERVERIVSDTIHDEAVGAWRKAPRYRWRDDVSADGDWRSRLWLTCPTSPTVPVAPRQGARFLREFTALGDNRDTRRMQTAVLRYANSRGHLGEGVTVRTRDGVELYGEPIEWWEYAIDHVSDVMALTAALRGLHGPDRVYHQATLAEHVTVAARSVTVRAVDTFEMRGDDAARAATALSDVAALEWTVRHGLVELLTRRLYERLSVAASLDPPGIRAFPSTLLAALRHELLRGLVHGRTPAPERQCPQCLLWFQPITRAQRYCSPRHQQLWNYHHNERKRRRHR